MVGPAHLLLYGVDVKLLDTRRLVLESEGYQVTAINDPFSLDPYLSTTPFDLLILCHTLQPDECRRIASLARLRWPAISTLELSLGRSNHPAAMLAQVAAALGDSHPFTPDFAQAPESVPLAESGGSLHHN